MRSLTNTEMQHAAGGSACVVFTGFVLTGMTISAILSSLTNRNCHWEPYIKEVRTPIYDAYGTHVYDNVDTYQDYKWTC